MTNEEAISIMNVIVHMLEEKYDTDRVEEAVDMAIKALEQEPCEDCISRKAVIEIVNNPLNVRLEEIIKNLPSIQQKPKTDVLDKIRAEIQEERLKNRDMEYDKIFELCILIIDKYKAESEDKE